MFEKQWRRYSLISIWYETNPGNFFCALTKRIYRWHIKKFEIRGRRLLFKESCKNNKPHVKVMWAETCDRTKKKPDTSELLENIEELLWFADHNFKTKSKKLFLLFLKIFKVLMFQKDYAKLIGIKPWMLL